jgi:hypothetical protein
MDTTEQDQAAPEADDSEQSGSPAQTVRVPNVSPGAKSGIDHTVIGSDALAPQGDDDDSDSGDGGGADDGASDLPDGDTDAHVAWVNEAETRDEARRRADLVYANAEKAGTSDELGELASRLHTAVYGKSDPATGPDGGQGDVANASGLSVDPSSQVPGEVVDSETAGTGEAVNADTGEVTPGGQALPTIEQSDGEPIDSPASEEQASKA